MTQTNVQKTDQVVASVIRDDDYATMEKHFGAAVAAIHAGDYATMDAEIAKGVRAFMLGTK